MKSIQEKDPCLHMSQIEKTILPIEEEVIDDGSVDYYYFRQSLPELFNIELDLYSSVFNSNVTGSIKMYELFEKIKYNLIYDITPEHYLLNKYLNGKKNPEYELTKTKLKTVCYNASFNAYKNLANLRYINNLMYLDIDGFKSKEEALAYKNEIVKKYDWVIACYRSLSKIDLHVIINVDRIRDNDDYNEKYKYINEHYFDNKLDLNSLSLTRHTVIPWDYDIYINHSPSELKIDNEFIEKGIRNTYIPTSGKSISLLNNSSTGNESNSGDNKKGICNTYNKKKVICSAYTFLPETKLEDIANDAGRNDKLILRTEIAEEEFNDPNIPLYFPEGKYVIEINLFPYRYKKIEEGNRNNFIGALTIKLIILNTSKVDDLDEVLRKKILNFILSINNKICSPPFPKKEVIKSFNSNCKRFIEGRIDISQFYTKKYFFWSKHSTLSTSEKMSISKKIKNKPQVDRTKQKIKDAIRKMQESNLKVTQKNVANESGLSIGTVKKYRKYYNELTGKGNKRKKENNANKVKQESPNVKKKEKGTPNYLDSMRLEDAISSFERNGKNEEKNNSSTTLSEEQKKSLFKEIFERFLHNLTDNERDQLYVDFKEELSKMPENEVELLFTDIVTDISKIANSDEYFHRTTLISNFWNLLPNFINDLDV